MARRAATKPNDVVPDQNEAVDDDLEVNLRAPAVVAARAIVVAAVCRRAHLELAPEDLCADDPEGERFDLAAWVLEEGLDPALTPAEQRLLKTRLGKLPVQDVVAASWQVERLAALAWALGLLDAPPPYDAPVTPDAVLARVPAPWDAARAFRTAASLRPEAEIAQERERAEIWRWRAEAEDLLVGADAASVRALRQTIREVAEEARNAGLLPPPSGHDFPVQGRAYRDAPSELREALAIVAEERLRALNWLCGFGTDWDHVPLDI